MSQSTSSTPDRCDRSKTLPRVSGGRHHKKYSTGISILEVQTSDYVARLSREALAEEKALEDASSDPSQKTSSMERSIELWRKQLNSRTIAINLSEAIEELAQLNHRASYGGLKEAEFQAASSTPTII